MFGLNIIHMFRLGVIVVVLVAVGLICYQSNKIDALNAEIETHKHTISMQSNTIKQLKVDAEYNRQLTLELSKAESDARSKSDNVIKSISKQIKESNAFNADAPSNVIEFLRK